MSALTVLVSAPYILSEIDRFRPYLEKAGISLRLAQVRERLSEDELRDHVGRIDGALCGDDAFTARILEDASPRLKIISKWGTGIDSIDLNAAERLGITVTNTPGAFTQAVADSVLGYVLAFARELPWMDQDMKSGKWTKRKAKSLHEMALGVVGVGRIGKAVLERARPFGTRLLGNDIVEIESEFVTQNKVEMMELNDLLRDSDFVSLNCDLNPSSEQLIDEGALSLMKPGAVLINTARGRIVDQHALIAALEGGRLAGAALDVFEDEPLPPDSSLREMDNVLLAPHNANSSPSAWERVHWESINNLLEGLGISKVQPTSGSEVHSA